ncbi:MAG: carboxymuconolactone decarboxylase family protein [Bacteroidota bacterium]
MFGVVDHADIKNDLLEDLGQDSDQEFSSLEDLTKGGSRYLKDLRVNLKNAMKSDHLSEEEIALLGLALATNAKNEVLKEYFRAQALEAGASEEHMGDVVACASLLAANNVFYRFRHFLDKEEYTKMPARIKMNIMAKPKVEKEFFELVSLAVSAVNGCEMCCCSHEQSLLKMGSSEERIFDAVRLASVITSVDKIIS